MHTVYKKEGYAIKITYKHDCIAKHKKEAEAHDTPLTFIEPPPVYYQPIDGTIGWDTKEEAEKVLARYKLIMKGLDYTKEYIIVKRIKIIKEELA